MCFTVQFFLLDGDKFSEMFVYTWFSAYFGVRISVCLSVNHLQVLNPQISTLLWFQVGVLLFSMCRGPVLWVSGLHIPLAAAAAKSLQSCPILCDPIDGSPTGSTVPGILQARILEWVAISFSNASKWKVKVKSLSCVRLLATPWTAAYQAPPSMGFSRQEYWSGVPLPY